MPSKRILNGLALNTIQELMLQTTFSNCYDWAVDMIKQGKSLCVDEQPSELITEQKKNPTEPWDRISI